jgi:UDP-N-acetyl-D-mannosaminuronate dehydrogenase
VRDKQKGHRYIKEGLKRKISDRAVRAGVIGLGYVGLPLALELAKEGLQVTSIDVDPKRVESVSAGISYVLDVSSKVLGTFVAEGVSVAWLSRTVSRRLPPGAGAHLPSSPLP